MMCDSGRAFATVSFAEHMVPTMQSPVNMGVSAKASIQPNEDMTTVLTIQNLQELLTGLHCWAQTGVRRLIARIEETE